MMLIPNDKSNTISHRDNTTHNASRPSSEPSSTPPNPSTTPQCSPNNIRNVKSPNSKIKRRTKPASCITRRLHRHLLRDRSIAIFFVAVYGIFVCVTIYIHSLMNDGDFVATRSSNPRGRRRRRVLHGKETDIPILIPSNSSSPNVVIATPKPIQSNKTADFGDLNYKPLRSYETGRTIARDPKDDEGHVYRSVDFEDENDDWRHPYYAFDDDAVRHKTCRRVSWHKLLHPTCNLLHEVTILEYKHVGRGAFRDAWLSTNKSSRYKTAAAALKTLRYKLRFKYSNYENIRTEALVMERLTSSPRIANLYAHCGTSVFVEAFSHEVEEIIVPGTGYLGDDVKLNDKEDVDPKNHFTPREKLTIALELAESLADLHGFKDGLIVHGDVQLCQWLRNSEGVMKLNDFNSAEVMLWDARKKEYCTYKNGGGNGQYRPPEEFADGPLNEKIDVYSMGNNIYALLTGLWNFYDDEDWDNVQKRIINGELPYLDPRYRTRSYAEGALVKIMERCLVYEPEKRASIFEIVAMLREAIKENDRLEASNK